MDLLSVTLAATGTIQALASIPPGFVALRTLLGSKRTNVPEITDAVQEVEEKFNEAVDMLGKWLLEVKEVHNGLQALLEPLGEVQRHGERARKGRTFDDEKYVLHEVHSSWRACNSMIINLETIAQNLKYTQTERLVLDSSGVPLSGPQWAIQFVRKRCEIDDFLTSAALSDVPFGRDDKKKVFLLINDLDDYARRLMARADSVMKSELSTLGKNLTLIAA